MKTKLKEIYEAPSTMIVEFKSEGLICESPQEALQDYVFWQIIDE